MLKKVGSVSVALDMGRRNNLTGKKVPERRTTDVLGREMGETDPFGL